MMSAKYIEDHPDDYFHIGAELVSRMTDPESCKELFEFCTAFKEFNSVDFYQTPLLSDRQLLGLGRLIEEEYDDREIEIIRDADSMWHQLFTDFGDDLMDRLLANVWLEINSRVASGHLGKKCIRPELVQLWMKRSSTLELPGLPDGRDQNSLEDSTDLGQEISQIQEMLQTVTRSRTGLPGLADETFEIPQFPEESHVNNTARVLRRHSIDTCAESFITAPTSISQNTYCTVPTDSGVKGETAHQRLQRYGHSVLHFHSGY